MRCQRSASNQAFSPIVIATLQCFVTRFKRQTSNHAPDRIKENAADISAAGSPVQLRQFIRPREQWVQSGRIYISIFISKFRKFCEKMFKVPVTVQTVLTGCFDDRIYNCACLRSVYRIDQNPILPVMFCRT